MTDATFEFTVRPASATDIERIAAHRMQLMEGDGRALVEPGEFERATVQALAALLDPGRAGAWVAESATGEAVGSTVLLYVDRLPSRQNAATVEGYLAQLHVIEGWRWHGVGMALLQAALAEARARSLGRVRLHATNEALAFYERYGFTLRNNDLELML